MIKATVSVFLKNCRMCSLRARRRACFTRFRDVSSSRKVFARANFGREGLCGEVKTLAMRLRTRLDLRFGLGAAASFWCRSFSSGAGLIGSPPILGGSLWAEHRGTPVITVSAAFDGPGCVGRPDRCLEHRGSRNHALGC